MILKINGVNIKEPKDFEIEKYNITKSKRLATGKMVIDFIAKKRKFIFGYDVLKGNDLETILNLIDTEEMFFELTYEENGIEKTATVYTGPIKAKKYRTSSGWYWKNVSFNLIEQ